MLHGWNWSVSWSLFIVGKSLACTHTYTMKLCIFQCIWGLRVSVCVLSRTTASAQHWYYNMLIHVSPKEIGYIAALFGITVATTVVIRLLYICFVYHSFFFSPLRWRPLLLHEWSSRQLFVYKSEKISANCISHISVLQVPTNSSTQINSDQSDANLTQVKMFKLVSAIRSEFYSNKSVTKKES